MPTDFFHLYRLNSFLLCAFSVLLTAPIQIIEVLPCTYFYVCKPIQLVTDWPDYASLCTHLNKYSKSFLFGIQNIQGWKFSFLKCVLNETREETDNGQLRVGTPKLKTLEWNWKAKESKVSAS